MTNRDINHILAGFDRSKATAYDKDYADRLYREYQNRAIDDTAALDTLRTAFGGKTVLGAGPRCQPGGGSWAQRCGRRQGGLHCFGQFLPGVLPAGLRIFYQQQAV